MNGSETEPLPALSLVAVPGRRRVTLDLAREVERRGFTGIYVPSIFGNMAQCTALALATERLQIATAIAPIYARTVEDFAHSAAFIHEISGGRFRFGIGVAHGPSHIRMGVTPGKPLADTRAFVQKFRSYDGIGELPPIVLAALRKRMVALSGEIAQGVIFANASRSHMAESLSALPPAKRADPAFLVANMIPTCISDDVEAAKAVNRRTLLRYTMLPNYRNYWRRDAVRAGRRGARRRRGVAGGRRRDADPGAVFRRRQPAQSRRGNLRRLRLGSAPLAAAHPAKSRAIGLPRKERRARSRFAPAGRTAHISGQ